MATTLHPEVADQLHRHLTGICRQAGIDPADAALIKYTMNAVYRAGPYVLRLARGPQAAALAHRTVAVAATLTAVNAPTIRLADDLPVAQPVASGEWVATIWQHAPTVATEPKPVDLATPLRALHSLDRLDGVDLPRWALVDKFRRRIDAAAEIPPPKAADLDTWCRAELNLSRDALLRALRQRCDDLDRDLATVSWRLPHGVIHSDAHTGNLLLTPRRSQPDPTRLLCDLDGICHGPREWDLVPTAHGATRFGRSLADYHAFTEVYGFDITTWPGWPVLRDMRELQLVTSTLDSATSRPEVAHQLAHRLRSVLTGDTTAVWTRHR